MEEFLKYLGIPVVCGFIGWITNKVCIIMTLRPIEFIGIEPPYLGWQGIIPAQPLPIGPFRLFGRQIGPWEIQGVFIKRRAEVAVDMGKVFAAEVMNPENITKALLKGPA